LTILAPDFKDQHAVITGGATGIGLAIAKRLAAEGALVTLMGRRESLLQEAAKQIQDAIWCQVDIGVEASVTAGFEEASRRHGPVTILVNNAGAARSAPFRKTDLTLWNEMVSVNMTGAYLCSRAVVQPMLEAGRGRIINVVSTAGLKGYAYTAAYTAAKHGAIGLTRAMAMEFATTGITVNAVCPGFADTEIVRESVKNIVQKTGKTEQESLAELVKHNPQKRLIDPTEVADAVVWLANPSTTSITGQAIIVAGGELM